MAPPGEWPRRSAAVTPTGGQLRDAAIPAPGRGRSSVRNLRCLLPDGCLPVTLHDPHPCGGYYVIEAWVYGPHGRIGRWLDAR